MSFMEKIKKEEFVWTFVIPAFWFLYWLFNTIDKFIGEPTDLWMGRNRLEQFQNYFSTIGIENEIIPLLFFLFVTAMETVAATILLICLIFWVMGKREASRKFFYYGTLAAVGIFTFFTLGDQVFGDRFELMEHTIYLSSALLSWFVYNKFGGFYDKGDSKGKSLA